MKIIAKCLLLLAAAAITLGAAGMAKAEVTNRVVAVVGDEVVTAMDLESYIKLIKNQLRSLQRQSGGRAEMPAPSEIRQLALERLIDDKIFAAEVKKQGLRVGEDDVDRYVSRIKSAAGITEDEFVAGLNREGLSREEYREQLKRDILKQRLIASEVKNRIVVSEAEVDRYIAENAAKYNNAGDVTLRAVFLLLPENPSPEESNAIRQRAEELLQQVKNGADIAEVAEKNSQGPGAQDGGKLGPLDSTDLLPEMREALASLEQGQVSEVVRLPNGFVFMKLLSRGGEGQVADQELRAQVRAKLEREAMDKRFEEWIRELRSKYYVRVIR